MNCEVSHQARTPVSATATRSRNANATLCGVRVLLARDLFTYLRKSGPVLFLLKIKPADYGVRINHHHINTYIPS